MTLGVDLLTREDGRVWARSYQLIQNVLDGDSSSSQLLFQTTLMLNKVHFVGATAEGTFSLLLFFLSIFRFSSFTDRQTFQHNDNWRLTRCLCGAIVGRCQERPLDVGTTTTYRVLKYAIRPVSLTAE